MLKAFAEMEDMPSMSRTPQNPEILMNNLRGDMIDWLVPHQANKRIIESTAERMGMPMFPKATLIMKAMLT